MVFHRIKDLREDNDMTQAQVGEKINVPQRTYAYYETGERMIPPHVLRNWTARNPRLGGNQIGKILPRDNGLPVGRFRFERMRRMALNGAKMNIA